MAQHPERLSEEFMSIAITRLESQHCCNLVTIDYTRSRGGNEVRKGEMRKRCGARMWTLKIDQWLHVLISTASFCVAPHWVPGSVALHSTEIASLRQVSLLVKVGPSSETTRVSRSGSPLV